MFLVEANATLALSIASEGFTTSTSVNATSPLCMCTFSPDLVKENKEPKGAESGIVVNPFDLNDRLQAYFRYSISSDTKSIRN